MIHPAPLFILTLTLLSFVFPGAAHGQNGQPNAKAKARYANHDACVTCHFPKPGDQGIAANSLDFVQTTPATIWENEDKHRQAFSLLLKDQNRELVRGMLGFDLQPAVKNGEIVRAALQPPQLAKLQECLRCHAARPLDDTASVLSLDLGVSCQACHGPGFQWFQAHQEDKVWRLVSPQAKERLHMTDVRSPVTRAKLCASCHVGDIRKGRFVTHEMYANGHPPLPSFEPESFAVQMPPHWRKLPEKPVFELWSDRPTGFESKIADWLERYPAINRADIRETYRQANFAGQHDPRQDLPSTRGSIVAGAVVLQSYFQLLADLTDKSAANHRAWPEFAAFDCTACHHELRTGPLETGRPFRPAVPGRPPMPLWPSALVRVGIVHLSTTPAAAARNLESFERRLTTLEAAIARQPFGDPGQIHTTATEIIGLLEALAGLLERSSFDAAAAERALLFLTDAEKHEIRDYHTARQLAWAIRRIATELQPDDAETKKLFMGSKGDDPLSLDLPAGQMKSVVGNLESSLDAIAKYDPDWFAAELKRARQQLTIE